MGHVLTKLEQQHVIGALSNQLNPSLIFETIVIFILGSVIGSFLNVVVDRFATNRSISKGRSYCESCKKALKAHDLIPVFSYLLLGGKCRYCKAGIPGRIFFVELISAVLLLYLYITFNATALFVILSLIVFLCVAIFFIDLEYGIIPDKLTIPLTLASFLYVFIAEGDMLNHLLSALISFLFFVALFVFTKGKGMGFGDVKISFALGLVLGFPMIIYGLYLAFLTGAIVSIILVLWKKKSFKKSTVPFGPFLVASTLFALFFGTELIIPIAKMLF